MAKWPVDNCVESEGRKTGVIWLVVSAVCLIATHVMWGQINAQMGYSMAVKEAHPLMIEIAGNRLTSEDVQEMCESANKGIKDRMRVVGWCLLGWLGFAAGLVFSLWQVVCI